MLLCTPESIIVLDAIETHLSMQAQALLADVLLDVIRSKEDGEDRNIQLFISTHSEAFLRRLQRRVAEGVVQQIQFYPTIRTTIDEGWISSRFLF